MDRDEVHHKMSKKVAQLTKVIFHLNTRNDEADLHLAAVTEAHEDEVEHILRDANAKVKKIAEVARAATGGQVAAQIEELKASFEKDKKEAMRELETLKSSMSSRETKNTTMWSERVSKMNSELLSLKQQSVQQVTQFKDALQRSEERQAAREKELVEQRTVELEAQKTKMQTEFEEQLEEQDRANVEARSALQRQLDDSSQQLSECQSRCKALEDELNEAKRRLSDSRLDGDEALRRSLYEREQLHAELEKLRAEFAESKRVVEEAAAESAKLALERDQQLEHWRNAVATSEQLRSGLEKDSTELQRKLKASEEALAALRKAHEHLQSKSASDLGAREADALAHKQRLEEEIQKLKAREQDLQQEVAVRSAAEAQLREDLAHSQDRATSLQTEIEHLRGEVRRLEQGAADALAAHERALKTAQAELNGQEILVASLRQEVESLRAQLQEQAAEMQRRAEELSAAGSQDLQKERVAHRAALADLERKHNEHCTALQEERTVEARELTERYEAQLRELQKELSSKQANSASDFQKQAHQLQELREKLAEVERQVQEVRKSLQDATQAQQASVAETCRLKAEIESLRGELGQQQKNAAADLLKSKQRFEEEGAAASDRHRRELQALRDEMSKALAANGQAVGAERERLEAELKRLAEVHGQELGAAQRKLDESREALQALRQQMQREVEKVRTEGVEMAQRLSKDQQEHIDKLTSEHSASLANLREAMNKSQQEQIDDLRRRHAKELEQLKAQHTAQLNETFATHEVFAKQMRSEHDATVAKLVDEAREASDRHATESARAQAALKEVQANLDQEMRKSASLTHSLQESRSAVSALEERIRGLQTTHEETLEKKNEDFAKEKRSLKEHHKTATERLLQAQLDETSGLKEQFHRARHLQDLQLKMLQDRLKELQDLYDNRPSREEDVERIAQLEEEVREKQATVKRLLEEMHFYKLELHNREQNYNKVFGAQPTVGILNPVASKKQASTGPGANGASKMHLVQQPGAGMGMQMGLPPLGGLPPSGPGQHGGGSRKLQKRPSSGSIKRTSVAE